MILLFVLLVGVRASDDDDDGSVHHIRNSTGVPLSANDSVIAFAANAAVAELKRIKLVLLKSLPASERQKINPDNEDQVYAAATKSLKAGNREMRKTLAAIHKSLRVNANKLKAIECQAITNVTALPVTEFLGQSVLLSGKSFVDNNCNGVFNEGFDNTTEVANGNPAFEGSSAYLLDIVQSTSDVRLKRIVTFVPYIQSNSTFPLFKQFGLYSSFFPAMLSIQNGPAPIAEFANSALIDQRLFGSALYPNQGGVEAPITFVAENARTCVEVTPNARFNTVPINQRLAFASRVSNESVPAGTLFGLCLGAFTSDVSFINSSKFIETDENSTLLGGVVFLDSNFDGIRNPRELTLDVSNDGLILFGDFHLGGQVNDVDVQLFPNEFGSFVQAFPIGVVNPVLIIGIESLSLRVNGTFSISKICGDVYPALSIGGIDKTVGERSTDSFFLNQMIPLPANNSLKLNSNLTIGIQNTTGLRLPTVNVGLACDHQIPVYNVTVESICDARTLSSTQENINDTFLVTVERGVYFETWLTAVTARQQLNKPIAANDTFTAINHTLYTNFVAAFNNETGVVELVPFKAAQDDGAIGSVGGVVNNQPLAYAFNEPQGNVLQLTVPSVINQRIDLIGVDRIRALNNAVANGARTGAVPAANGVLKFNITIITPYSDNVTQCAGISGAEIVTELVLSNYDGNLGPNFTIGNIGGLCRHRQPAVCVNGAQPPLPAPSSGESQGPAPDGTVAVVVSYAAVVVVLILVFVAAASIS
jgi:hypothetical protein